MTEVKSAPSLDASDVQDVAVTTEADIKQSDTPTEIRDEYLLPDWFLTHNVHIAAELDELQLPCRIVLSDIGNTSEETANNNNNGSTKSVDGESPEHVLEKTRGNDKLDKKVDILEYKVSYNNFSELRDVTAAAFVRDQEGQLSPSHLSVLILSSTDNDIAFIDGILLHLAKDLQATLVSVDLEDLEDLGWEFDRQEQQIIKASGSIESKLKEEPDRDPLASGLIESEPEEESDEDSLASGSTESKPKEEPDRNSLTRMAVHYFGARCERHASESSWNRNKKAIAAILDAQSAKSRQRTTGEKHSQATSIISSKPTVTDSPPLLLYIRGSSKIINLWTGDKFLARFRNSVKERRKSGQSVVLLASLFKSSASESAKYDHQQKLSKKLSTGKGSTVTITASNPKGKVSPNNKNNYTSEVNIRRLKCFLQWRIPHLLAPEALEALQSSSPWAVQCFDGNCESMGASLWTEKDFQRAFTQITGLAFGKSHIDLKDVGLVLSRIGLCETVNKTKILKNKTSETETETWSKKLERIKSDANSFEKELIACIINPDDLQYTYDDVIMDEETKETVRHLVSLSDFQPGAASAFLLKQIRITGALFYGPPGSGKTHLSRAIAKASGASMLAIDSATIQSKWVGETEKYIKAAFTLSAKLFPCVLFIDEVDSLFYRRNSGDKSWQRSALAQFLSEMDGLVKNDKSPFVVVATNRPRDLDEAFYRRLPQKIYFKLPDIESRAKILQLFLKEEDLHPLVDINGLARQTEGYSGSDLRNLCAEAALNWAMEQMKVTRKGEKMNRLQLNVSHIANALKRIRPTVSKQVLKNLSEFVREFNPEMKDVEEATRIPQITTASISPGDPDRTERSNHLRDELGDGHSGNGAMEDLEEAIRIAHEAVDATPPDHLDRARWLSNLGIRLGDRYSCTGAMADLEEAIRIAHEAVDATPPDHPDRAGRLNNLGAQLGNRYSRTGGMADLEEAIRIAHEAVNATPPDHPDRAALLNNLGVRLGDRYSRTGAMADLEEAIRIVREAVDATPPDHPDRAGWLSNLGNRLGDRYSRTGAMEDLEEAIRIIHEAVDATPPDHPDRAGRLNNLGAQLGDRYSRTGAIADLEEAIRIACEAVDATPPDHPDRAGWLSNLGARLGDRYSRTGAMADLEKNRECLVEALRSSTSSVNIRIEAGRRFLLTPHILDNSQAYTIAKTTIDLIPLLTPQSLKNTDKQHLLSAAVGISSDAAAIALHAKQGPLTVIQCLETGRGIIAGALFEKYDISTLERNHPKLAKSFLDLRDQLDKPATQHSHLDTENPIPIAETEGRQRREAEQQLLRHLETIRSISGFERFLLPPSKSEMLDAASHGPIVILNVSQHRCDALIIEHSGIRLLELPRISLEAINNHTHDIDSIEALSWLWDDLVCPVLNDLGFTSRPSGYQLPRVWWVPTGKLTKFPLHAAGHHLKRSGETALDRVVSSYASSVKAIIHSRRQQHQAPAETELLSLTAVAMNETKGLAPLRHASREVDVVLTVLDSQVLPHSRPPPHKNDVLSALETCKIFHFAGHGSTHPIEPLQSTLLLEDWEQEPLTVGNLLDTNLSLTSPFLAYLSACGTGQIRHEESVDESIHLANACQLAGFRHVVGTLWSVDDELCVDMARMTYEFLRDEGIRDECVSRGLHHATRMLRDQWIDSIGDSIGDTSIKTGLHRVTRMFRDMRIGSKRNSRSRKVHGLREGRHAQVDDSPEITRPLWVPYVHFGV